MSALTLTSGEFTIVLTKVGVDTASLHLTQVQDGEPMIDENLDLDKIEVKGNMMTCETWVSFLNPTVTLSLIHTGVKFAVNMDIEHSLFKDGVTSYPITEADFNNAQAWLASFGS